VARGSLKAEVLALRTIAAAALVTAVALSLPVLLLARTHVSVLPEAL